MGKSIDCRQDQRRNLTEMSEFWQDHPVVWSQVTLLENFLTQDNRCFQKSDFQWEISCFLVFVSISIGLLCFPTTNSKCWAQFSWTMDITIWKKMEENMKEFNDEFLFTRILTIMFLIFWRSHWKVSSTWFLKQLITIMKLLLQGLSVECGMSTGCLKIYKKVRTKRLSVKLLVSCFKNQFQAATFNHNGEFIPTHRRGPDIDLFRGKLYQSSKIIITLWWGFDEMHLMRRENYAT